VQLLLLLLAELPSPLLAELLLPLLGLQQLPVRMLVLLGLLLLSLLAFFPRPPSRVFAVLASERCRALAALRAHVRKILTGEFDALGEGRNIKK
jgi:hypothetical protein